MNRKEYIEMRDEVYPDGCPECGSKNIDMVFSVSYEMKKGRFSETHLRSLMASCNDCNHTLSED